jgi:hypothetical protein
MGIPLEEIFTPALNGRRLTQYVDEFEIPQLRGTIFDAGFERDFDPAKPPEEKVFYIVTNNVKPVVLGNRGSIEAMALPDGKYQIKVRYHYNGGSFYSICYQID